MKYLLFWMPALLTGATLHAQGWQQQADYRIQAALDTQTHKLWGQETIVYSNNSPDTLNRLFFHLYPNAFQPGSSMDVRSRWLPDSDPRVSDRISKLSKEEEGFLHIDNISINGRAATVNEEETIAEIVLAEPILPGQKATIELSFTSQVPVQIRRSGRDNAEGVDYSMPQWYPKLSAYD